jgi:hypothetical protein
MPDTEQPSFCQQALMRPYTAATKPLHFPTIKYLSKPVQEQDCLVAWMPANLGDDLAPEPTFTVLSITPSL